MLTKASILESLIQEGHEAKQPVVYVDVVTVMRKLGSSASNIQAYAATLRTILVEAGDTDARTRILRQVGSRGRVDFAQVVFTIREAPKVQAEPQIPKGAEAKWRRLQQYTNSSLSRSAAVH